MYTQLKPGSHCLRVLHNEFVWLGYVTQRDDLYEMFSLEFLQFLFYLNPLNRVCVLLLEICLPFAIAVEISAMEIATDYELIRHVTRD